MTKICILSWLTDMIGNYLKLYLIVNVFYISTTDSYQLRKRACGVVNQINYVERIVGGYDVGYYKYPWFAALEHTVYKDYLCGGTLISSRHVITAAHCITTFSEMIPEEIYNVHLGITNICSNKTDDTNVRKVYSTWKVIVHEKYTHTFVYDIAILILNTTVYNFVPICLPFPGIRPTAEGTIIGLGVTKPNTNITACSLKEARILKYSPKICYSVLRSHNMFVDKYDMQKIICAGYLSGKIDACEGDSGGPFQIIGPHNRMVLKGIISFGFGCAEKGSLGVYTNVSYFLRWILSIIRWY